MEAQKILSINVGSSKNDEKIIRVYNSFLSMQSENTKRKYEKIIPQFFKMVIGKHLSQITADDLEQLEVSDVKDRYMAVMKDRGYKNTTIINYISAIRSFLSEMERNRVFLEDDFYDYQRIKEVVLRTSQFKDDSERRKTMGKDEYDKFHEWIIEGKEWSNRYSHLAYKYQLALEFMYVTAIRVNSVFSNITWADIKLESDSFGNQGYVVYALDKGNKVNKKPISNEFYMKLKNEMYNGDNKDLIFKELSKRSFTNLCKDFSNETGQKITPHSIKNGAGTKLWNMTKDPMKVKDFLDHESLETTLKYIRTDNNFLESGSFILSSKISIDNLNEIDYNDIVNIVKENEELAYQVINKANLKGLLSNEK